MTPKEFIYEYLKADQDTGAGSYEKMLSFINDLDWSQVKVYILKLRYFYFLKTSYWMIISSEVKRRAGWKCLCGCRENLQVHHGEEGDKYHGEEHLILDKLICLCGKCHQKLKKPSTKDVDKRHQRINRKESILIQLPYYPSSVPEESISGSSFTLTRKLLEELEHDRKVIIERKIYEGWKVHRC